MISFWTKQSQYNISTNGSFQASPGKKKKKTVLNWHFIPINTTHPFNSTSYKIIYRRQVFSFPLSTNILQIEITKHTINVTFLLLLFSSFMFLKAASLNKANAPYRLLHPINVLLEVANYGVHVLFCFLKTDKSKWTSISMIG